MSDDITLTTAEPNETEEPKKGGILGIFESNKARDAKALVEITERAAQLDEENTELHKRIAELESAISKNQSAADQLEGKISDLEAALTAAHSETEAAEESAGKKAANLALQSHVPAGADLPATATEGTENIPATDAELEEQLKACDSHAERSKLIKQYRNRRNN